MPARLMRQNPELRRLFRQRIQEKVAREKVAMHRRIDDEVPALLAWLAKPLAGMAFDQRRRRDADRGQGGELSASFGFWLWFGKEWVEFDDVVLEPRPDEFIQVDHVLIGPPGVCLVETKTWDGAFTVYHDNWRRKDGNRWVQCENPIRQNERHLDLFEVWARANIRDALPAVSVGEWLWGAVLLLRARWLKVTDCTMPIYQSAMALASATKQLQREEPAVLTAGQIDAIAAALAEARPCPPQAAAPSPPAGLADSVLPRTLARSEAAATADGSATVGVEHGQTPDGRHYVSVTGSAARAESIRRSFEAQGRATTEIRRDNRGVDAWFFYWE